MKRDNNRLRIQAAFLFLALFCTSLWAQNPDGQWQLAAPMPTARKEINHSTVELLNRVYVIGGVSSAGQISTVLEIYDPVTDQWQTGAPLPVPLWRAAAAGANGRIYVFGGYTTLGAFPFGPSSRVFEYDPAADTWTEKTALPSARGSSVAVTLNGEIHVLGGANTGPLTAHDVYDPVNDSWRTAAALDRVRSNAAAAVYNGTIHLAGGYFLNNGVVGIDSIVIYDPLSDSWTAESSSRTLPLPRFGMAAVSTESMIYFFGGNQTVSTDSRAVEYDPISGSTRFVSDMPSGVSFGGAAPVGNRIYVSGGGPVNLNQTDAVDANRLFLPPDAADSAVDMNPSFNGAWFNPETAGQGILVDLLPDTGILFMAWFTYDVDDSNNSSGAVIGDPGHRWITAQGGFIGNTATLTAFVTSGGQFDDPAAVSNTASGSLTLTFIDCLTAELEYSFPQSGLSGTIPLQRIANDNVGLCQS